MKLKVLLVLSLLLSVAFAGDHHDHDRPESRDGYNSPRGNDGNDNPDGPDGYDSPYGNDNNDGYDTPDGSDGNDNEHDCHIDPCSLPAPADCVYESCEVQEHSCTPIYYDNEDNEVCQGNATTDACPAYGCFMYCPYGFKRDDNGCPKCECIEYRSCNEDCSRVECGDHERPVILPGDCCPTCVPSCDNVYCSQVACVDDHIEFYAPYDCCPTCMNATDCNMVDCMPVECDDNELEMRVGCCSVCMSRVKCGDVDCPPADCAEGQYLRMRDDHCCPVCVDAPQCQDTECPDLECAKGEVATTSEDECCPHCIPENACDNVVCPAFTGDCPDDIDYHVKKNGTCCSYCPGTVCKDTVTTRCDSFDRPVCAPGLYRGDNCTEPVPASERVSIQVEITVNGLALTADDIKFFIANKLSIDAMYIGVDMTGNNTFVITIAWSTDAPPAGMDQSAIEQAVSQAISANPNFLTSTNKKESTSNGSRLVVGSILFLLSCVM